MKYIIIAISVVCLVLFLNSINFPLLIFHLNELGTGIFLVLFISFLAYLLATVGWLFCFKAIFKIKKLGFFFVVRQIGESLSIINPTGVVGGDAVKSYLIRNEYSIEENIGSVTASRGITWMSYLIVSCLVVVLISGSLENSALVISLLLIVFLIAAFFILFKLFFGNSKAIKLILHPLKYFISPEKFTKVNDLVDSVNGEVTDLWQVRPAHILIALVLFSCHYLLGAVEFKYILYTMGQDISIESAIILEIGTSLVRSLAVFVPGQIGIEEYSNKMFLSLVGIGDDSTWVSLSIIRRIRQLFWILFGLVTYFSFFHKKIAKGDSNKIKDLWKSFS